MPLEVGAFAGTDSDQVQPFVVTNRNSEWLFMLIDGSETGFDYAFQPVVRAVGNAFLEAFITDEASVRVRLEHAIETARTSLVSQFPVKPDCSEYAGATFIAVVVSGSILQACWIGSAQLKVFRRKQCVYHTQPHTFRLEDNLITTRYMTTNPSIPLKDCDCDFGGPWELRDGDAVVLGDALLFDTVAEDEILGTIAREARAGAQSLVDALQARSPKLGQSVVVAKYFKH